MLQHTNRVPSFTYNKTNTFVGNRHDLSKWRRWPVRCQQVIINDRLLVNISAHSISCFELLVSDQISSFFVGGQNSTNKVLRSCHFFLRLTNNQDVLFVLVLVSKRMAVLMRTSTSNEHFATSLFFKAFLVNTFGTDEQTNKVYALVSRQVYFWLELRMALLLKASDLARHYVSLANTRYHELWIVCKIRSENWVLNFFDLRDFKLKRLLVRFLLHGLHSLVVRCCFLVAVQQLLNFWLKLLLLLLYLYALCLAPIFVFLVFWVVLYRSLICRFVHKPRIFFDLLNHSFDGKWFMPLDVDALISFKSCMTFPLWRVFSAARTSSGLMFVRTILVSVFVESSWLKAVRWAVFICVMLLFISVKPLIGIEFKAAVRKAIVYVSLRMKRLLIWGSFLFESLIIRLVAPVLKAWAYSITLFPDEALPNLPWRSLLVIIVRMFTFVLWHQTLINWAISGAAF